MKITLTLSEQDLTKMITADLEEKMARQGYRLHCLRIRPANKPNPDRSRYRRIGQSEV